MISGEIRQTDAKTYTKEQRAKKKKKVRGATNSQNILEKYKMSRYTHLLTQTYYKAVIIKTVCHRHREQTHGYQGERGWGGVNWEFEMCRY